MKLHFFSKVKKQIQKYFWLSTFMFFSLVQTARADSLIPCEGTPESPCGFTELMALISGVIEFILKYMVLPIAVVIFIYGGFLYMTSGDNPGKRTDANKMFRKLLIGIFFCLAAWVIVGIILKTLGYNEPTFSPVITP